MVFAFVFRMFIQKTYDYEALGFIMDTTRENEQY